MRQVFTSPRIENVEGVAAMLRAAGIETRITNGRSWRGAIRGNFSYRDDERARQGPQPAVWIVNAEDQPRARELLRDAGLLDSTRTPQDSFLSPTMHAREGGDPSRKRALRLKLGLLLVIAIALALALYAFRKSHPPTAPAAAPATHVQPAAPALHAVAMPEALAETLLRAELAAHDGGACVSIDHADVPAAMLARLQASAPDTTQASACANERLRLDAMDYRTDGSGVGEVRLRITTADGRAQTRTLEVERVRDDWRVLRVLGQDAD